MILFTNGCSFTSGTPSPDLVIGSEQYTEQWQEGEYRLDDFISCYQHVPFSWPNLLTSDKVINLGRQGSSNARILRTTLNFLDKVDLRTLQDCVFVICWTMCNRQEYWYKNVPFKVEPRLPGHYQVMTPQLSNNPEDFYIEDDLHSWMLPGDHQVVPETINKYEALCRDMSKDIYDTLTQMIVLKNAFDFYNIDKFLYTSLFWQGTGLNCVDDEFSGYTDWHNPLLNMLPQDHIIEDTSVVNHLQDVYFSDGHLNELGNQEFARYIQQELEKRNWLT